MKGLEKDVCLQEMSLQEMQEVNGGIAFIALIPLAKAFTWGVATGAAIGLVVLDNLLDRKK